MGAYELRHGVPKVEGTQAASPDLIAAMDPDMLLDFVSIRINGERSKGKDIKGQISFADTKKNMQLSCATPFWFTLKVRNLIKQILP